MGYVSDMELTATAEDVAEGFRFSRTDCAGASATPKHSPACGCPECDPDTYVDDAAIDAHIAEQETMHEAQIDAEDPAEHAAQQEFDEDARAAAPESGDPWPAQEAEALLCFDWRM